MRQSTRQFFNDAYNKSNAFASIYNDKTKVDIERIDDDLDDDEVNMGAGPLSRLRRNKQKKKQEVTYSDIKVDMNAGIMDLMEEFQRFA